MSYLINLAKMISSLSNNYFLTVRLYKCPVPQ